MVDQGGAGARGGTIKFRNSDGTEVSNTAEIARGLPSSVLPKQREETKLVMLVMPGATGGG